MPGKRRSQRARRSKRERRRVRHNQNNKKEGIIMTGNISDIADVTEESVAAEAVEDKTAGVVAVEAVETIESIPEVNTETVETEAECHCREGNEVENKKPEASHKLYIQYNDLEFSDELMFEAAVNAYCNEHGQDKSSVEAVNLYVKPQEGKAYYVINNDAEKTGSIDL